MWARIASGLVAELTAIDPTDRFHPDLVWVDVTTASPAPQDGWTATETGGVWAFAAPVLPARPLPQQAAAALDASDTTMHRIGEAVALALTSWTTADVVTFVTWRRALRAIVDGSSSATTLPARPAYPAGT
jgi:hypothetical protein